MTPDEQELAKQGMEVAFSPVRDFFAKLVGQPAEEVGATLTDAIRVHRWKRSLKLLEEVKREAAELGIEPRKVPLKTLLPILEAASLEEDEDMHERWKWLLLNASDPAAKFEVSPRFPEILKSLSPREATMLNGMWQDVVKSRTTGATPPYLESIVNKTFDRTDLERIYKDVGLTDEDWPRRMGAKHDEEMSDVRRFEIELGNLIGLGLVRRDRTMGGESGAAMSYNNRYYFTTLGFEFVAACREPSRSDGE